MPGAGDFFPLLRPTMMTVCEGISRPLAESSPMPHRGVGAAEIEIGPRDEDRQIDDVAGNPMFEAACQVRDQAFKSVCS